MSNPLLDDKYFNGAAAGAQVPAAWDNSDVTAWPPPAVNQERAMTMAGAVWATGALLVLVVVGAVFGWTRVVETTVPSAIGGTTTSIAFPTGWVFGSMIVGFVLVMACTFKPNLARFLGPVYALAEGVFLGAISHAYDIQSNGIAIQAVIATAAVFLVMLALYSLRVLRATPKFVKGVTAATMGVFLMYLVGWIASLFGADLRFWNDASPLGIGISVVIVAIAAFNLILDFDFVERGARNGLPAHMEWFAAVGLVATLVWLYLEMLRLLSKLRD